MDFEVLGVATFAFPFLEVVLVSFGDMEGCWVVGEEEGWMCHSECSPLLMCHIPRQHTLMDSSLSCPGCRKTFSKPRYQRSHLSQTTNPTCIAIRNTTFSSQGETPPSLPPQSTHNVPIHPTLSSNGYGPNTTEDPQNSTSPSRDDPSDVEGEDNGLSNTSSDEQSEDLDTSFEDYRHSPTPSEFIPLPEEPQVEPVKTFFPGQRAGEVLSEGIPTITEYENNLGGPTPNPYSPFNSEIDWELAKWPDFVG